MLSPLTTIGHLRRCRLQLQHSKGQVQISVTTNHCHKGLCLLFDQDNHWIFEPFIAHLPYLKKFAKKTSSFSTERITIVELICCQNSYQRHTYDSVQSITYVARPPIANRERTVFTPLFHTFIQLCHKSYSIQHQRFIGIVEDQTTWFLHFLFHISVLVQCLANESLDLRTSLVVAQIQHRKNVFSKTTPLGRNLS